MDLQKSISSVSTFEKHVRLGLDNGLDVPPDYVNKTFGGFTDSEA